MILSLLAGWGQANDVRRDIAAGADYAYVMLPPETVCGSQVEAILWTADGKTLVARRSATGAAPPEIAAAIAGRQSPLPKSRTEIVVWDVKSRRARTIYSVPNSTTQVGSLEAMPGSDRLVLDYVERIPGVNGAPDRTISGIGMISTTTAAFTRISSHGEGDAAVEGFFVSPTRPLGALLRLVPRQPSSVRFFGPDGKPGPAFSFPARAALLFDDAGLPGYVGSEAGKDGKQTMGFHRIDLATGRVGQGAPLPKRFVRETVPAAGAPRPSAPEPPLSVQSFSNSGPDKAPSAPSILLLAKGGRWDESGVVSTDGVKPLLSPNLDAVAYVSQGSAMVRLLSRAPRAAYDQAVAEAAKAQAISRAKQVGVALMIFAADNDEVLPGGDVDMNNKIYPYVKNREMLVGFTYTFSGGDLSTLGAASATELGYVAAPGGRATIFADGHVKWVPDQP